MYRRAKSITSKRPNVLVSDGAQNFNLAFRYEFFTKRSPRSHHIHLRLTGSYNSNKMERFNGEVRGGEKVMRGLKSQAIPRI
jgi:hypothetical protein